MTMEKPTMNEDVFPIGKMWIFQPVMFVFRVTVMFLAFLQGEWEV